jgi:xanthine dehydrogenase accessory factor
VIELFREVARRKALGEAMAMATIIRTGGSTPAEAGAKMVVAADGTVIGTIGGGYGEHRVWKAALETIRESRPRVVRVELTTDAATGEGALCGGTIEVFVEPIG